MARAKRKPPAKPAGFISPQHRGHFCRRHPIPEHKAPAADNTHPTKTSRPGQTAPTDARTQKTRCRSEHRRPLSFLRSTAVTSATVIRYPNTKPPPPPTIHTPQKPHGPVKRHRPTPEHKKTRCRSERHRPLSFLRTTAVTSAAVIRYPNTKPPPPPTIHTPQKPHGPVKRHRPTPEHKKTRCRSERHRPFPLSLKKPQRCLNAIVQRQPPPAGAQHHLTQPNPNISGRRFTAFFALRCL